MTRVYLRHFPPATRSFKSGRKFFFSTVLLMLVCFGLQACSRNGFQGSQSSISGCVLILPDRDDNSVSYTLSKAQADELFDILKNGTALADNRAYAMRGAGHFDYNNGIGDVFDITDTNVVIVNGKFPRQVDKDKLDRFLRQFSPATPVPNPLPPVGP